MKERSKKRGKKKKASRTLAFPVKDGSGIMNLFVNFCLSESSTARNSF